MTDIARWPGLVLGVGIGGFIDGTVLHQLLEWHHMLSGWYPLNSPHNMRVNMIGDALFHLFCLAAVILGVALLARAGPRLVRGDGLRLTGWIIAGWGLFNVVEGIVDHLILGVHHVRPGGGTTVTYDIGFLILGAVLVGTGVSLGRHRRASGRGPGGTAGDAARTAAG